MVARQLGGAVPTLFLRLVRFMAVPAAGQAADATAHVVSYDVVACFFFKKNFLENETTLHASGGHAQKQGRLAVAFLGPLVRAEQPFSEAHRGEGVRSRPLSTSRHPQCHRRKQARVRRMRVW